MKRRNVGLSRLAQVALAATALSPILLVWAAATYERDKSLALSAVAVAVLMVTLCIGMLTLAKRELQSAPLTIVKASRLDQDALSFLIAYALPLVISDDPTHVLALLTFAGLVAIVLVQLRVLHVNPLLGMLGYHFYQIELLDSDTALVISRSHELPARSVRGQQLAPALWLLN